MAFVSPYLDRLAGPVATKLIANARPMGQICARIGLE